MRDLFNPTVIINLMPQTSLTSHSKASTHGFAILLASIIALLPFSLDTYLSAMPTLSADFGVKINRIESTLSLFLIGSAAASLFAGSFSDHHGRRFTAMIGLLAFIVGSFGLAMSQHLLEFQAYRLLQAIGAGFSVVVVGASVRDRFTGNEAARIFALIGLIMMGAPLLAPIVGSYILKLFNWQAIFYFLALYGFVVLLAFLRFFPKFQTPRPRTHQSFIKNTLSDYAMVLKQKPALAYMLFNTASLASMFCFLTESSFIYMELYGVSETRFSHLFACNIITMIIFNRVTALKLKTHKPQQILAFGVCLQLLTNGILLTVALSSHGMPNLYALVPLIMLSVGSQGLISANASSCYMDHFEHNAGSANAVYSSSSGFTSALLGIIVATLHDGQTIFPMAIMMCVCTLIGTYFLFSFSPQMRSVAKQNLGFNHN